MLIPVRVYAMNTPKCATFVVYVSHSLSPGKASHCLHWCRTQGPRQLLWPLLWRPIYVLAPILGVDGNNHYLVLRVFKTPVFAKGQKSDTHPCLHGEACKT